MTRDRIFLVHILEAMEWIQRFTVQGRDDFLADRKNQSAVLRELEISEKRSKAFPANCAKPIPISLGNKWPAWGTS